MEVSFAFLTKTCKIASAVSALDCLCYDCFVQAVVLHSLSSDTYKQKATRSDSLQDQVIGTLLSIGTLAAAPEVDIQLNAKLMESMLPPADFLTSIIKLQALQDLRKPVLGLRTPELLLQSFINPLHQSLAGVPISSKSQLD